MPIPVAALSKAFTATRALVRLRVKVQAHMVNAPVELAKARSTELAHHDLIFAPGHLADLYHPRQSVHQTRLYLLVGVLLPLREFFVFLRHDSHRWREFAVFPRKFMFVRR